MKSKDKSALALSILAGVTGAYYGWFSYQYYLLTHDLYTGLFGIFLNGAWLVFAILSLITMMFGGFHLYHRVRKR